MKNKNTGFDQEPPDEQPIEVSITLKVSSKNLSQALKTLGPPIVRTIVSAVLPTLLLGHPTDLRGIPYNTDTPPSLCEDSSHS
jgi:hypothetical protein